MFDTANPRDVGFPLPPEPPDAEDTRDARIEELENIVADRDQRIDELENECDQLRRDYDAAKDDTDHYQDELEEERKRGERRDVLDPDDETWHEAHAAQFLSKTPRPCTLSRREWADRLIAAINAEV